MINSKTCGSVGVVIVCVLVCSMMPLCAVQAEVLNSCDQWAQYCSGDYCVYNDVWNPPDPNPWSQCIVAESCTQWYVDASFPSYGSVKSYPNSSFEYVGQTIGDLTTFTSTASTSSPHTGKYNTAWDLWVPTELMIWFNKYGNPTPGGTYTETATVDGVIWDIYKGGYISFVSQSNFDDITVDIKAILDYCVSRGWYSTTNVVGKVQCGFEIRSTDNVVKRFTMNNYSVSYILGGTVPAAPNNLTATAGSGSYINLSWTDDANNETGFYVERSTDSPGSFSRIATLGKDTTSYNDTGLSANTTYYYRVCAYNGLGSSDYSNVADATTYPGIGVVLREWWIGVEGTAVSDLTSDVNYPDRPSGREFITSLEGPTNWADNYGTRIRGYLHPVADGNYTFLISSDANSELWLSTDDSPANTSLVARVPEQPESSPVSLAKGGKYYIEVLHKAADGNDNIAVSWGSAGAIDGKYLSPCCLDFRDYASFAVEWRLNSCSAGNSWCGGADFNRDGSVTLDDMELFAESWLEGVE